MTDSWYDYFNNCALIAAYVTYLDDPVRQFAGYISEAAGGVAASADDDSAIRWLAAAYNMELANNIVYQTPSSFMTTGMGLVQDLKFPRDVFRDKAGTCVDLAITYAALAQSTGLNTYLMNVPGHCFAVIELPSGRLYAVENTGLGGGETRMTFDQAVKTGNQELAKMLSTGPYYLINVKDVLTNGRVTNPELPSLDTTYLETCGIKRITDKDNNNETHKKKNFFGL